MKMINQQARLTLKVIETDHVTIADMETWLGKLKAAGLTGDDVVRFEVAPDDCGEGTDVNIIYLMPFKLKKEDKAV